jgi:ornithine cyclodeaminase/alanine dehydrogenase-like protein (mu-crystallin family)
MEEAGDLLVPLAKGEIDESHIHAELGEIVDGRKPGRTNPGQITYFKSVGVAVQDAVAGRIALQNARARNLGSRVPL